MIIGSVLLLSVIPIVLSSFNGRLVNETLAIDMVHDYGYMVMYLLLLPFFIFFIPFYLRGLGKVLDQLRAGGTLIISDSRYGEAIDYSNRLFNSSAVTWLPYVLTFLLSSANLYNFLVAADNSWFYLSLMDGPLSAVIVAIPTILFYLFFFLLAVRVGATFLVINRVLDGNLDVQPLHPDNCGGLSPLGEFAMKISWAGIGVGLPIMILVYVNYSNNIPNYQVYNALNIGTYLMAMVTLFFMPLLGARKSMMRSKNEELRMINNRFQVERRNILARMNSGTNEHLHTANLEELIKLYEVAKAMPVYPFNTKNVVRFLGGTLWPILLLLVQYAIDRI